MECPLQTDNRKSGVALKLHCAVLVCSSSKSLQCLFFLPRITPPFHTSSPEHQKYTPPSASRRGHLFDGDEFLTKNAAGPRNLLEVVFFFYGQLDTCKD